MIKRLANITDALEHFWEETFMKRAAGSVLVVAYLITIGVIELNRRGLLPGLMAEVLPSSHFFAVEVAFTLLLFTEVVSLVFGLTRSFSRSIGIQIEILSLILLRDTFKKFTDFPEPIEWGPEVIAGLGPMIADAAGALAVFVILGIYYRIQKSRPITSDTVEQQEFINDKKVIALGLLITFAGIGFFDLYRLVAGLETYPFFESFYTVLIFTDVLMVLLSLRYSINYAVTFRNFGYAVVTVFIRLVLVAPVPLNVVMGIGTALFALFMAFAYNAYMEDIDGAAQRDAHWYDEEPEADAPQSAHSEPGDKHTTATGEAYAPGD